MLNPCATWIGDSSTPNASAEGMLLRDLGIRFRDDAPVVLDSDTDPAPERGCTCWWLCSGGGDLNLPILSASAMHPADSDEGIVASEGSGPGIDSQRGRSRRAAAGDRTAALRDSPGEEPEVDPPRWRRDGCGLLEPRARTLRSCLEAGEESRRVRVRLRSKGITGGMLGEALLGEELLGEELWGESVLRCEELG